MKAKNRGSADNLKYAIGGRQVSLTSQEWTTVFESFIVEHKESLSESPFFLPILNCLELMYPPRVCELVEGTTPSVKGLFPIGPEDKYLAVAFVGARKVRRKRGKESEIERYIAIVLGGHENKEILWRMIEREVTPAQYRKVEVKNYRVWGLRLHQVRRFLRQDDVAQESVAFLRKVLKHSLEHFKRITGGLEYCALTLDKLRERAEYPYNERF